MIAVIGPKRTARRYLRGAEVPGMKYVDGEHDALGCTFTDVIFVGDCYQVNAIRAVLIAMTPEKVERAQAKYPWLKQLT